MGESLQGFAPFFLLDETNMNTNLKTLVRYILPALGGLFVAYLYNVVDGIFVGRGVGSAALGAVNIAVPFITTVVAVTAMFPMGGAAIVAIRMGRGIVLEALMIFCLPLIFGAESIWLAPLVTEVVTLIATVAPGRMKRLSRN